MDENSNRARQKLSHQVIFPSISDVLPELRSTDYPNNHKICFFTAQFITLLREHFCIEEIIIKLYKANWSTQLNATGVFCRVFPLVMISESFFFTFFWSVSQKFGISVLFQIDFTSENTASTTWEQLALYLRSWRSFTEKLETESCVGRQPLDREVFWVWLYTLSFYSLFPFQFHFFFC